MAGRQLSPVEPFVERIDPARDLANGDAYRFGYRVEGTKDVLSAVDIPAEAVERFLTAGLCLSARMSPSGDISAALTGFNDIAINPGVVWAALSIEVLVANAVSAENLRLEEAGPAELKTLLKRLESSVGLVIEALSQISES
jgi:hypothetical protein